MIENQLLPDIVIQLNAEGKDVLKRILPKRMEQWTKKMQLRKEKRSKIKAKKDRDKVRKIFLLIFKNFFD
jgi:DNA-binding PadR family transcriptional regulator